MPVTSCGLLRWLFHGAAVLEDFADRLNHVWTTGLLLILAAVISWKQCYSNPMFCASPAHFTTAVHVFAENTCWNSYFISNGSLEEFELLNIQELRHVRQEKTGDPDVDQHYTVTLYQLVPVILCFQALLFKLPYVLMHVLHGYSGVNFEKVAGLTQGYKHLKLHERRELGKQTGRYLYHWCRQWPGILPWRLLTLVWLVVKLLYCINVIVQMCLVDKLLSPRNPLLDNSTSYADVIITNLFENNATLWKHSPMFPRQLLCDLQIRQMRMSHRSTIQCNVPTNAFTEHAYMLLWVWLLVVSIVTCISLITWLVSALLPFIRRRYAVALLSLSVDTDRNVTVTMTREFQKLMQILGEDGTMVLRLISRNSSEFAASDAIATMWRMTSMEIEERHMYALEDPITGASSDVEMKGLV